MGLDEAKAKLAWVLQSCKADFQAHLADDFFNGKYRVTFTKGSKQYKALVPVEWLDDCSPGKEVSPQMDGVIEKARRELEA